ncbi:hypothetical protein GCM10017667_57030 [Streptomyces filamentosus]|uniref:Uncharacterized protein n=1 Tax=Streptomyces filamentosus TaxID=67294 RepID=A0A919BT46_STRFL|nr:hypothetical protein GCM10017667_57030 [Streptomyces filamentosus]
MRSPPLSPPYEDVRRRAPARFWSVSIVFLHDPGDRRGRILHRESGRSQAIVTERPVLESVRSGPCTDRTCEDHGYVAFRSVSAYGRNHDGS